MKKILIYIATVIVFFVFIPEFFLRILTSEQLARASDFTSLGGILNPFLSLLIFLGLFSIILALITVAVVGKIYRLRSRPESR